MRTVIIGAGAISLRWIRTLRQDGRLAITTLIDPDRDAAALAAQQHQLDIVWAPTLKVALQLGPLQVAVNLTPPHLHASVSREALTAGLHVLSEKPLATSLSDARQLVELARSKQRLLAVMRNRGEDPCLLAFRDLLAGFGPPYAVSADVFVSLPHPGFRAAIALPATTDLAVHGFDQIQQLVSAPPLLVSCTELACGFLGPHCSIAVIAVAFADGSVFTYRGGYMPGLRGSANGLWRVDAATATARWNGEDTVTLIGADSTDILRLPLSALGYQQCITAMLDALARGEPYPSAPLGTIALLDAACSSAASHGQPVQVIWP